MRTYQVNDVTLQCLPCDHCGVIADENEAMGAVARHRELMGVTRCAACGEEIRPMSWEVVHTMFEGGPIWYAVPLDPGSEVTVQSAKRRVGVAGVLHESCARRAMPHLPPEFWDEVKAAAPRAIWPKLGT